MNGLYWHIPFCKKACHYCDFYFQTTTSLSGVMVSAMISELSLRTHELNTEIGSVYFGGGTPSLLSIKELARILEACRGLELSSQVEITLEANPDDLNFDFLNSLMQIGINRLSIGIQSFEEENLKLLNRAHNRTQTFEAIEAAQKAGFHNISVDLIYGLPSQTVADWQKELETVFALGIQHLSAYCLTIEPGTTFEKWHSRGKISIPSEEVSVEQFLLLNQLTQSYGFEHYEVSNLAVPSFYSKHNINYWKKGYYIGIGPSAHSYCGTERSFNVANNRKYISSIENGILPSERETLTTKHHINETIMTGLRTCWGCDFGPLKNLGYSVDNQKVDSLVERGLGYWENDLLKLNPKGWLLCDQIASDLFWI